jgi:hypothetical protein
MSLHSPEQGEERVLEEGMCPYRAHSRHSDTPSPLATTLAHVFTIVDTVEG